MNYRYEDYDHLGGARRQIVERLGPAQAMLVRGGTGMAGKATNEKTSSGFAWRMSLPRK